MDPIRKAKAPIAALALVALLAAGCSREAIVLDDEGRQHEGYIVGGDATHLHMVPGEWASEPTRIPREAIREIDHPGDAVFWTGFGLTAVGGVAALSIGLRVADSDDPTDDLLAAGLALLIYAGTGVPLMAWGSGVNRASKEAARGQGDLAVRPFVGPKGIGVRF